MRLDKFLKVTGLIKRRTVAKESAEEGVMKVNGRIVKPSYHVSQGDILEIDMWNYYKKISVDVVPAVNNIPKNKVPEYITVIEYRTKEGNPLI